MFSFTNSTTNNNMSPFPQYYFPSSSSSTSPNYLLQPLPQLPPSSSSPLPSLLVLNQLQDHHDATIFLPQSHPYPHDPTLFLPTPPDPTSLTAAAQRSPPKKPPAAAAAAKKDRHSKIYTAQGLRDRRVRLSIDIAREFFDLHDMLGFDKASRTLEWLLAKSRKAIRELDQNHHPILSRSQANGHDDDNDRLIRSASHISLGPDEAALKAKESRAKARARARARTKEKRFKCYYSSHASSRGKIGSSSCHVSEGVVPIKTCSNRSQLQLFDVSSKGEISNNNNNSSNGIYSSSSSSTLLLPGNWDINSTALSPPRPSFRVPT